MTTIEWTQETWNPVTGCSIVSPGCTNCYAMHMANRLEAMGSPQYQGTTRKSGGNVKWTGQLNLVLSALDKPLHWKKPRMVFVNSMSDLFHPDVPISFIHKVVNIMRRTPRHTYQILTKRPENMLKYLGSGWPNERFPPNVWVGVSVENAEAKHRIETLETAARLGAVRHAFLSVEPLLEDLGDLNLEHIDWVIVGGESGKNARPMQPEWVRNVRDQCLAEDTPFFFKQWGGRNKKRAGRELDGRTYDANPCVPAGGV